MKESEELSLVQYLLFELDDETYAVKAQDVQEIVDYIPIKKVPGANEAIRGITNIRGDLIPIIDPKVRLDLGETQIKKRTSFIIFKLYDENRQKEIFIGMLVDLVIEVDNLSTDSLVEIPEFGTKVSSEFIENLIRYDDEYLTVLNISSLLNIRQLSNINKD